MKLSELPKEDYKDDRDTSIEQSREHHSKLTQLEIETDELIIEGSGKRMKQQEWKPLKQNVKEVCMNMYAKVEESARCCGEIESVRSRASKIQNGEDNVDYVRAIKI